MQRGKGGPPGFEQFWAAYPSKVGKGAALASWQKHRCEARADQIVAKVQQLSADDSKWAEGYVKNPATWLNQGGWDDEPRRAVRESATKGSSERGAEAAERRLQIGRFRPHVEVQ